MDNGLYSSYSGARLLAWADREHLQQLGIVGSIMLSILMYCTSNKCIRVSIDGILDFLHCKIVNSASSRSRDQKPGLNRFTFCNPVKDRFLKQTGLPYETDF